MLRTWDHSTKQGIFKVCHMPTPDREADDKSNLFFPGKITPLRKAMNDKSPVKIRKFEFNEKFRNIVIKNNATVITSQEPLPFQPLESIETRMVTLQTLKMTSPQQLINLKATVKGVSGSKVIKVQKNGKTSNLTKSSATLVDPTGSTTAVFWEEWADCVQQDKTYIFTNLRVKGTITLVRYTSTQPKRDSK